MASKVLSNSDGNGNRDTEQHNFLQYLSPDTKEYRYTSLQGIEKIVGKEYDAFLNENKGPFVVFTHISLSELNKIEEELPGRVDYHKYQRTLILTMLSAPHEVAAAEINCAIAAQASQMGVRRGIYFLSSTRAETPDRAKEADVSFAPRFLSQDQSSGWPTVAVEVGYSETKEKLYQDILFWLNQSGGRTRLAISVDIKRPSGNIYIAAYEHSGMVTRGNRTPNIRKLQQVTISRGAPGQPPHIVGDEIIIPFRYLVSEQPRMSHNEEDFKLTKEDLTDVAEKVWEMMQQKGHLKD